MRLHLYRPSGWVLFVLEPVPDVYNPLAGEDQDLMVTDDVLMHDVHLLGQPTLVRLPHNPGPLSLLPVVIPHNAIRVNVSKGRVQKKKKSVEFSTPRLT